MIRAKGKTLFEWSMESMRKFFDQHFIFACLNEHDDRWIKECSHRIGISQTTLRQRPAVSLGQAQTAYDVLDQADNGETLWIYNIDTYIEDGLMPTDIDGYQGCAHVFESQNSGMSFVGYDNNGRVTQLAEKKVISQWATVGVYGFESAALYKELYEKAYHAGGVNEVNGERYVAPMYELILRAGGQINAPRLSSTSVHILGTPEEVLCFDPEALPPCGK
jgi:NDP-sugar pyrophosphorylase family protein